jgi:predicted transcriptional regulator
MSTISLRVSDDEYNILKTYAKVNNCTLSDVIRQTMMKSIEDEYDMRTFAEYEKARDAGTVRTYSHDEAWKELGL